MTEIATQTPPSTPELSLTTREDWDRYMFDEHLDYNATTNEGAFFYPPEVITPDDSSLVSGALLATIRSHRKADGTYKDPAIPQILGESPLWDALDGGIRPAPSAVIRDPHVLAYLDHRRTQAEERDMSLRKQYPEITEKFLYGIHRGRQLGYVPDSVTDQRAIETLRSTGVHIIDHELLNRGEPRPIIGDYDAAIDTMRISTQEEDPTETVLHEARHKLSGGTFVADYNIDDSPVHRTRLGLMQYIGSKGYHRGVEEALVEHFILASLYGDWHVLDPRQRNDGGSNALERIMLAEFIVRSGGLVNLKTLSQASFEDTAPGAPFPLRREMMRQVMTAYGPGALHKLDKLIQLAEIKVKDPFMDRQLRPYLHRIHAPEFDQRGVLQKRGWINTTIYKKHTVPKTSQN